MKKMNLKFILLTNEGEYEQIKEGREELRAAALLFEERGLLHSNFRLENSDLHVISKTLLPEIPLDRPFKSLSQRLIFVPIYSKSF